MTARIRRPALLVACLTCLAAAAVLTVPRQAAAQDPCIICEPGGGDAPPAVWITPSTGSYSGSGATYQLAVTIEWCDDYDLRTSSRVIRLNGQSVTSNFSFIYGSDPSCGAYATSTGTVTLQSGTNSLTAEIGDYGGNTGSGSGSYSFAQSGVSVTAAPADTALSGEARSIIDSVRNLGGSTATYSLTATGCPGGCSVPATVNVPSGQSAAVSISYTAGSGGSSGASGTITLTASAGSGSSATQASGSTNYYVLPDPVVAVFRDDESLSERTIVAGQASRMYFVVRNPSTVGPWTYSISVSQCSGVVSACTADSAMVTAPPGDYRIVAVSYSAATAADQPGSIGLRAALVSKPAAAAQASVSVRTGPSVAILPVPGPTPVIEVVAGPGGVRQTEKAACLHFRLVPDVAVTCGALEVVHSLPAVRTLNFTRRPTLLYYSDVAAPLVNVALNILPPTDQALPDSVRAQVLIPAAGGGYTVQATRTDAGIAWADRTVKRIGLAFPAPSSAPAHLLRYQVLVTFFRGGATDPQPIVEREVAVVNRLASSFGAGWWLATLEQLHPLGDSQGRMLWVDGDAGTRVYSPVEVLANGDSVFVAPAFASADTLVKLVPRPAGDSLAGTAYVRRLGHPRARVEFDVLGFQRRVVTEFGHVTSYIFADTVTGPSGQPIRALQRIAVAPEGAGLVYDFQYSSGFLEVVTAPAGRRTVVTQATAVGLGTSARRIMRITDPDSSRVDFSYLTAEPTLMETRVDRRGSNTAISYAVASRTVATAGTYANPQQLVQHAFRTGYTVGAGSAIPLPIDSTVTLYNGPRTDVTDVTRFWLDSLGQPTRVVNALGDATMIERADARWPALATRTVTPTGPAGGLDTLVTTGVYDSRGRLVATTLQNPLGDARNSTTTYGWDERWNRISRVTSSEGVTSYSRYDSLTGYRSWQQIGPDPARRVTFDYYLSGLAAGMVRSTTLPGGVPELYTYDPILANLSQVRTPLGFTTSAYADALGRDTLTVEPGGVSTRRRYDVLNQVTDQWTAAGTGAQAESIHVHTDYDLEGLPLIVTRRPIPDPNNIGSQSDQWWYDALGRDTVHAGVASSQRSVYNPAGLVLSTSRGDSSLYDALGRRIWHWLPPVTPSMLGDTRLDDEPTNGAPADAELFAYDRGGNLTQADNRYARIRRSYYPNGAIRRDSSTRRTEREYDLDGRPLRLRHDALTGSATATLPDVAEYSYDANTGALRTVRDPEGNLFTYTYDNAERLLSLSSQLGVVNSYTYDLDSRVSAHEGVPVTRDERGKVLAYPGFPGYQMTYSPLGNLTRMTGTFTESYVRDPLGNIFTSNADAALNDSRRGQWQYYYNGSRGGVRSSLKYRETEPYIGEFKTDLAQAEYDQLGDRVYSRSMSYATRPSCMENAVPEWMGFTDTHDQYMTYDANGRLRYVVMTSTELYSPYCPTTFPSETWTSGIAHRYDALGRRIWSQTTEPASNMVANRTRCCWTRDTQVWDGAQLLEETRASNVALSNRSGRVVYTQGIGVDQPLSFARRDGGCNYTAFPKVSWRGLLDAGGGTNTGCIVIEWPEREYSASRFSGVPDGANPWDGSLVSSGQDKSGLTYLRNRYYDPKTGQFTQEDPIGLAGGLNVYGFANGDPVNFSDPFGLCGGPREKPCPNAGSASAMGEVVKRLAAMAPAMEKAIVLGAAVTLAPVVAVLGADAAAAGAGAAAMSLSAPLAGRTLLPAASAGVVAKLNALGQKFGVSATDLANRAITHGTKMVDMLEGNAGNVNAIIPRLDGASGFIRVTLDPTQSRIISAGLQSANQVRNGLASGRFVPVK